MSSATTNASTGMYAGCGIHAAYVYLYGVGVCGMAMPTMSPITTNTSLGIYAGCGGITAYEDLLLMHLWMVCCVVAHSITYISGVVIL